jgi:nitroreductase
VRGGPPEEATVEMYKPLADAGIARRIVAAAGAAPSIHNTQPWRFRVAGDDLLEVHGDPERMLWVADAHGRALHLSCGAALFNLRLAARITGAKPLVWPLPDPQAEPTLMASVQLAPGRPATFGERELFGSIWQRHTSRAPFSGLRIPDAVWVAMEQAAGAEFALLRPLDAAGAARVLRIAADAEQELAEDFDHRVELAHWIGTDRDDGVPATALGSRPDRDPPPVRDLGRAAPATPLPAGSYEPRPQLAVLATARDDTADWLRAGQALQRVLLTATIAGLAASFLYQPVELHDMRRSAGWWPWPECPQIILRLGYGPVGAGSPRRRVDDILDRTAGPVGPASRPAC